MVEKTTVTMVLRSGDGNNTTSFGNEAAAQTHDDGDFMGTLLHRALGFHWSLTSSKT